MPPKKATGVTKKAAAPAHASYRDMIKDAIVNLKERNGSRYVLVVRNISSPLFLVASPRVQTSARQAIKKYVSSNNKINVASQATFDAQFNKAIKAGVEKGEFTQPKGPSGPVKLAKKEPAPKPAAKPAAKKATTAKKPAAKATTAKKTATSAPKKTAASKAATTTPKPAAAKKATTTKKTTAAKPKANSGKARKTTTTAAPAIVEQPKVIGKTKSGRVTKTTAAPKSAPKKRATPKK
ncbi:Histone H1 [Penicillium rolfsii]|nr:Histone H1 [Penicillium rolfsii]